MRPGEDRGLPCGAGTGRTTLVNDARLGQLTGRVFYGWWIVLAGSVSMALGGGLFFNGFGFFFEPIRQHFGWSVTLLSGAFALTRVESGFLGPLEGYLIQRFGPRAVMTVAFVVFGLGFLLLSRVSSPLTFYLAFIVLATGAGSAGFSAVMACINNWFRRKRASAIGFAMLGMGLGGVVFPPTLAFGFDNYSWKTVSLACGVFVLVVGMVISRVVRYDPEPYGYLPDGVSSGPNEIPETGTSQTSAQRERRRELPAEYDFGVLEALKTRAFWLMSIGHAMALLVISTVSLHQVPFLETQLGFSKASTAVVVMVLMGTSMLGQLAGGYLGDRFPKNYMVAVTILGHSGGLFLLATADGYPQVMVSAVVQGLAWGMRSPVLTSMRGDYFGRRSFAVIMGFSQAVTMVGMIIGPILSGYFADNYSYELGFKVIAASTAPGVLMFVWLKSPQPSRATPTAARPTTVSS